MESDLIVSVAVPTPLRQTFDYRVKSGLEARVGSRVRVPFRNRQVTGILVAIRDSSALAPEKIRPVSNVYDSTGDIPPSIMRLCLWAADYYAHPPGEVFVAALPPLLRKGWNPLEPARYLHKSDTAPDPETLSRAPAQRGLLNLLQSGPVSAGDLEQAEISSRTVKTLTDKQWIHWEEISAAPRGRFEPAPANAPALELTAEQSLAIETIAAPATYLLQGITGSGKTEVYLRVMDRLLQAGQQILVLVPEIGLTPQTIDRFRERFSVPIAIMHSSLTEKERAENWYRAKEGQVGIIIGTRSAIFTPMAYPGAIIVDEEHDSSYKQQDGFRYSARDMAVLRGRYEGIPVILGSATPSLESLHNVETGKYRLVELNDRPPGAARETYDVIDVRHLELYEGFTRSLRRKIGEQLTSGNQVLLFLNRRGFAPVMICNACQWIAHCRRCDARLTYHLSIRTLVCHHCGAMSHNIISCQSCGSNEISAIGQGTQRIEKTLRELFPEFPVIRIDRDSTRRKGTMEDYVAAIHSGEPALLVGTQMLAKGHHFPNVTLVAMLEIDSGFYSSDFRAIEKLGQLILQVGGRAGRADKPGQVVIQTAFASHPLLKMLIAEGFSKFAKTLLDERRQLELPPYSFTCLIRAESGSAEAARRFLETIARKRRPDPSVVLSGPIPALMERKAGRFRQILLLSSTERVHLHQELMRRIRIAESLPEAKKVRWSVDVDPSDLF